MNWLMGLTPFSSKWYSHNFKSSGVRYEVGVSIEHCTIVWANGSWPCDEYSDLSIFRDGLKQKLGWNEFAIGNSGYTDWTRSFF